LLQSIETTTNALTRALLFNTLSTTYQRMADLPNSRKFNRLALETFERRPLLCDTLLWYSSALTQYAELHQHVPSAKRALQLLDTNFPHSQHRSKASAQLILADIYFEQAQI